MAVYVKLREKMIQDKTNALSIIEEDFKQETVGVKVSLEVNDYGVWV